MTAIRRMTHRVSNTGQALVDIAKDRERFIMLLAYQTHYSSNPCCGDWHFHVPSHSESTTITGQNLMCTGL
jgi:hypothetical protein